MPEIFDGLAMASAGFQGTSRPPTVNLSSCNILIFKQSARICYSRCCAFISSILIDCKLLTVWCEIVSLH
jgi:hypothetical protein